MPNDDGLDELAGIVHECGCDYPHGHDFEPPFESCTCVPGCSHDVKDVTQEDSDIGEDDDWDEDQLGIIYPPEEGEIGEEILHA